MADNINVKTISVCFVCPKAYSLFNPACKATFGGAEVDLYFLSTELAKDPAFRISFITADYGQPPEEILQNVRVIKSLSFRENPFSGAWKIWQACKRADAGIYTMKTFSVGTVLLQLFCRCKKRAFIYRTAHSSECDGTFIKKYPFVGKLFKHALRKADKVFAQNHIDRENLLKTLQIEATVIPNGHRFIQTSIEKKHILWVGRTADFKYPGRFLELAEQFPQEKFIMICPPATGDTSYPDLQNRVAGIKNLEFLPRVEFHQIDTYFQKAKILVNTSDSEGFANTFIQAGAAGTAILSYAVNPDDFLTRYNCGVYCFGDMQKLAAGLRFLLENNRYIEIGQNARKYVEENHDISKIVDQYKEIFIRLTGQNRRKQVTG
jgi:glycosyltransferase involved in cell wall biosynthesis